MLTRIYKFLKSVTLIGSITAKGSIGAPILALRDGTVVDGNSRLRIAKQLGHKSVPVVFVDSIVEYVSPDELKESY